MFSQGIMSYSGRVNTGPLSPIWNDGVGVVSKCVESCKENDFSSGLWVFSGAVLLIVVLILVEGISGKWKK